MPKTCITCGGKHYAKGFCAIHYRMPSQINPKPVRVKPQVYTASAPVKRVAISKVADKRAKELRLYAKIAPVFKLANPYCHARLSGCTGKTTDIHHMCGRENWRLNDVPNFLPVCRNCHDKIEIDSAMAREKGFSIARTITHVSF